MSVGGGNESIRVYVHRSPAAETLAAGDPMIRRGQRLAVHH
jgi:hypothetical protein